MKTIEDYKKQANKYLPILLNPYNFNSEDVLEAINVLSKIESKCSNTQNPSFLPYLSNAIREFKSMLKAEPISSFGAWERRHKNEIRSAWN